MVYISISMIHNLLSCILITSTIVSGSFVLTFGFYIELKNYWIGWLCYGYRNCYNIGQLLIKICNNICY